MGDFLDDFQDRRKHYEQMLVARESNDVLKEANALALKKLEMESANALAAQKAAKSASIAAIAAAVAALISAICAIIQLVHAWS